MRRGSDHIHEEAESLSETLFGIQNTVSMFPSAHTLKSLLFPVLVSEDEDIKVSTYSSDEENISSEEEEIDIPEPMDTEPTDPYGKTKIESDSQTDDYLRKPNKGIAATNSKKGFVPAQIPFYPNQEYYEPYPMVNQPIGTNVLNYPMVNQPIGTSFSNIVYQSPMSQDLNLASHTSYAEIIKDEVFSSSSDEVFSSSEL
ncbi:hypothetical protein Gotur_034113 [Gossypium turneri]